MRNLSTENINVEHEGDVYNFWDTGILIGTYYPGDGTVLYTSEGSTISYKTLRDMLRVIDGIEST